MEIHYTTFAYVKNYHSKFKNKLFLHVSEHLKPMTMVLRESTVDIQMLHMEN